MTDTLEATILGCGSSSGVPRLGGPDGAGDWGACDPANPKNRRQRCSLLVRRKSAAGQTQVLVDTSPDLHDQLLAAHVAKLDAVFITHDHADQLHGIDDLRPIAYLMRRRVDVYTDAGTMDVIHTRFGYCFESPPDSGYPPILTAHTLNEPFRPMEIDGAGGAVPIEIFEQTHGRIRSLGFRFGPIAYSSDVNHLSDEALSLLEGVDTWIVDALRYTPHPTHAHVERTLGWIERLRPNQAILTNLHIDLDFEELTARLPPGVHVAYDGLRTTLQLDDV